MDPFIKENLITTKDASELSGYTSDYLARLVRRGEIIGKRIGHSWVIDGTSLTTFLDKQKNHKLNRFRELADTRSKEYYARNQSLRQPPRELTKKLDIVSKAESFAPEVDLVSVSFGSRAIALALSLAVVLSGAALARAEIFSQVVGRIADVTTEAATGLSEILSDVPSGIAAHISDASHTISNGGTRAETAYAIVTSNFDFLLFANPTASLDTALASVEIATRNQLEHYPSFSLPAQAIVASSFGNSTPMSPIPAPHIITRGDIQTFIAGTYSLLTSPSRTAHALVNSYIATGTGAYALIHSALTSYRTLIERTGEITLALAATTRDTLVAAPRLISRMNLAMGNAIIDGTHTAIQSEVNLVYGTVAIAPETARVATSLMNTVGGVLFRTTAKVPVLVKVAFLRTTEMPARLAPALSQAVFDIEYREAYRFVALTGDVSDKYLSLIETTGHFAYTAAVGTRVSISNGIENLAYLSDSLSISPAAVALGMPPSSIGENFALSIYRGIQGFFNSVGTTLAFLFSPSPLAVAPQLPRLSPVATEKEIPTPKIAIAIPPSPARQPVGNSYPTYTTVVQGISADVLNHSLATQRDNILATVAGMIQPVAAQTATNITTIQQVNMIQDLANLIVHNGDFRGGTFDNGRVTNGISVSAATGSFGSLSAGITNLATTTVTGDLAVSGVLSSGMGVIAPYFTATSTTATSTFAGSLNVDNGGFVYATSTRNIGIGVLSPAALLAIQNSTSTQPLFIASNDVGTEVYRITNNGFVGIGTTTPGYALAVEGSSSLGNQAIAGYFTATSTTATSTFAGSLAVGTTSPWGNGLLTVGTSTPLLHIDSNTGNVGINSLASVYRFDVNGTFRSVGDAFMNANATIGGTLTQSGLATFQNGFLSNASSTITSGLFTMNGGASTTNITASGIGYFGTSVGIAGTATSTGISLLASGAYLIDSASPLSLNTTHNQNVLFGTGNVGIGVAVPNYTLDVSGNAHFTSYIDASHFVATSTTATSTFAGFIDVNGTGVNATSTFAGNLSVAGNINLNGAFLQNNVPFIGSQWTTSGSNLFYNTGNIGIGTSTPGYKLEVNGSIKIDSGSLYFADGTSFSSAAGGVGSGITSWSDLNFQTGGILNFQTGDGVATSTKMNIMNSGFVGIGTTTPGSILSLGNTGVNTINLSTTATSTFGSGINVRTGCFAVNGVCISGGGSGSVGAGTQGQLAFYDTAGTNLMATSSLTLSQTGNFGIGTTSPYQKLSVAGNVIADSFIATSTTATSTIAGFLDVNGTGANATSTFASNLWVKGTLKVGMGSVFITSNGINSTDGSISLNSGTATSSFANGLAVGTNQFVVQGSSGNIGIGTTSPGYKLDVNGAINATSILINGVTVGAGGTQWVSGGGGTVSYVGGSVGIGTTTPGSLLSIGGSGTGWNFFDNATSTKSGIGGINLAGGCFAVNGVCISSGGSGGVGAGTQGQLAFYNAAGTNLIATSLLTLSQTGNFGVGTTSPLSLFSIGTAGNAFRVDGTGTVKEGVWNGTAIGDTYIASAANWNTAYNNRITSGSYPLSISANTISLAFGTSTSNTWGGTQTFTNAPILGSLTGLVASNNGSLYQVASSSLFGFTPMSNMLTKGNFLVGNDAGVAQATSTIFISSTSNVGIGTTSPYALLSVGGNVVIGAATAGGTLGNLTLPALATPAGTFLAADANGVLIATTSPSFSLGAHSWTGLQTMAGGINVPSGVLGYSMEGNLLAYASSTNQDTIFGLGAGGQNATTSATGGYNTAIGYQALNANTTGIANTANGYYSLKSNTTGNYNIANGYYSLKSNTIGTQNTANGIGSLFSNTTGSYNTANGYYSLFTNTTGNYNSALGYQSLYNLTTGYDNIALGHTANTGGNNITTGYNNILLGYNTVGTTTSSSNFLNIGNSFFGSMIATSSATSLPSSFANVAFAIATSSFTGNTLTVQNASTLNNVVSFYSNAGASLFEVNDSGTVGIASTTPFGRLSVDTSSLAAGVPSFVVGSSTRTDLIVTQSGNIGVGTTSPGYALDVAGSSAFGTGAEAMRIDSTGYVGIGTSTPYAPLSLLANTTSLIDLFAIASSTSGIVFKVDSYGRTYGDGAYSSPAADYAEYFYTNSTNLQSGEVVCVDILENNAVKRCERGADNNVMGIVSTKPSVIGNYIKATETNPSHYAIIGMMGQVNAYASAENGPISVGDSLTSASSTSGYAMRADSSDSTVGIALEPLTAGTGQIKVLISRRNKSLAVEDIEALVVDRIANMKIEDKVQQLVKDATDKIILTKLVVSGNVSASSYEAATTSATAFTFGSTTVMAEIPSAVLTADGVGVDLYKLATYTLGGVQALVAKFDAQDVRITALETRMAALDSGAISSASGSPLSFSTTSLASAFEGFSAYIGKGFAQFGTLIADRFVAATNSAGTSSAGTVSMLIGNTVAEVKNVYVTPATKIFVTFNAPVTGSWYVSDKQVGSFRVVLSAAQTTDVSFDYFLVQTEGQTATSTPNGTQNSISNTDTNTPPVVITSPGDTASSTPSKPVATTTPSVSSDTVAPAVILNGSAAMQLTVGDTFTDAGATATDGVDGDLTAKIIETITDSGGIKLSVFDTSAVGSYSLTYSATDAAGNTGSAGRMVSVIAAAPAAATSTPPI